MNYNADGNDESGSSALEYTEDSSAQNTRDVIATQRQGKLDAVLRKIARLKLAGVAQSEIAQCMNLSDSRISQILTSEEYAKQQALESADKLQRNIELGDGWDDLEGAALKRVKQAMLANPDADFALRVAAVANKATRRAGAATINPSEKPSVVVHLNPVFIEKLQQNFDVSTRRERTKGKSQREVSVMDVAAVVSSLSSDEDGRSQALSNKDGKQTDLQNYASALKPQNEKLSTNTDDVHDENAENENKNMNFEFPAGALL